MGDQAHYPKEEESLAEQDDNGTTDNALPPAIKEEVSEIPPSDRISPATLDRLTKLGLSSSEYEGLQIMGYTLSRLEKLQDILHKKLEGILRHLKPVLRISDIVFETGDTHMPSIPHDLSLPWFLENRKAIAGFGDEALKGESQPLKITRAIWFYGLDRRHQLFRNHNIARWNSTAFLALLTQDDITHEKIRQKAIDEAKKKKEQEHVQRSRDGEDTQGIRTKHSGAETNDTELPEIYMSRRARSFVLSYLSAVFEAHKDPGSSIARDAFVFVWKRSRYELLPYHPPRAVNREITRLKNECIAQIEKTRKDVNGDAVRFDEEIGKFIGAFIVGKKEQKSSGVEKQPKDEAVSEDKKIVEARGDRTVKEGPNRLLQALEADWGDNEQRPHKEKWGCFTEDDGGSTPRPVVGVGSAIKVVQETSGAALVRTMRKYFR